MDNKIKCNRCKSNRNVEDFIQNDKEMKTCNKCRESDKIKYDRIKSDPIRYDKRKSQKRENSRLLYITNRDRILEKAKLYYKQNKEVILARRKIKKVT